MTREKAAETAPPETQPSFRLRAPDQPLSIDALVERHIHETLTWARGNKTLAAQVLGINRRTLFRKLAKYQGKTG